MNHISPPAPDPSNLDFIAKMIASAEDWIETYALPILANPSDPRNAGLPDDARDNHAYDLQMLERILALPASPEKPALLARCHAVVEAQRRMFQGPAAYRPAADQFPAEFAERSVGAAADSLDPADCFDLPYLSSTIAQVEDLLRERKQYLDAGYSYPVGGHVFEGWGRELATIAQGALNDRHCPPEKVALIARINELRDEVRECC